MKPDTNVGDVDDFYSQAVAYIAKLNPPLPENLEAIRNFGIKNKVPIIDDELGFFLKFVCSIFNPGRILEIGCGISYSTHWMLYGSSESKITALDSNRYRLDQCRKYLQLSENVHRVQLVHNWAKDFFEGNSQQFDLIFLDSTKKEYIDLLDDCYLALVKNGLLIVDNIFYNRKIFGLTPDQKKKYGKSTQLLETFNQKIANHPNFSCTFLPMSDGVLVAKRTN
ncbi:MAG: methyltransferase domain-containing protein [Deltaproteobacteria bacterium]|nr:methyltransferase domain-containing protein [Deltaproteobacteria bacterium]